ncbi:MAG TPA: ABC transporter ATP-binding protein [Acetobacteraceae bacterium]|nr:ABC transporter ATP-binding protein [Acetobacteraceae bacterium]
MPDLRPVLELVDAEPRALPGTAVHVALSLAIRPGEFVMVQCGDAAQAASFADICCGLWPLSRGIVRFFGRDWTALPDAYVAALRGRIGRVFGDGGWIDFLDMEANILLPQLHHTREDIAELRVVAAELGCAFGLPGLPSCKRSELSAADLAGAAFIRAFLGEPLLVILESPLQGRTAEFSVPLLTAIARARDHDAAVLWLTVGDAVWSDRLTPATARLRLTERGLAMVRRFA